MALESTVRVKTHMNFAATTGSDTIVRNGQDTAPRAWLGAGQTSGGRSQAGSAWSILFAKANCTAMVQRARKARNSMLEFARTRGYSPERADRRV
jgi:hypothetical protein